MKARLLLLLALLVLVAAVGVYYGKDSSTPPPALVVATPVPASLETPKPRLAVKSRMAVVSVKRLFEVHPKQKPFQNIVDEKRGMAMREWERLEEEEDTAGMHRLHDAKKKEFEDERKRLSAEIAADIQQQVSVFAARHDLGFVFDTSGQSLNGVPVVMSAAGLTDVTDEIIKELQW